MKITLLDMQRPSDVKKLYEEFNKRYMECYSYALDCYKKHCCNYSCHIMDNNDFACCSLIHLVCKDFYNLDFNEIRFVEMHEDEEKDFILFQFYAKVNKL